MIFEPYPAIDVDDKLRPDPPGYTVVPSWDVQAHTLIADADCDDSTMIETDWIQI